MSSNIRDALERPYGGMWALRAGRSSPGNVAGTPHQTPSHLVGEVQELVESLAEREHQALGG